MKGDIIKVERAGELDERLAVESDSGIKIKLIFLNAFGNRKLSYEIACALRGIHTSTGCVGKEILESMKRLIADQWNALSCSISYAKGWIRRFLGGPLHPSAMPQSEYFEQYRSND